MGFFKIIFYNNIVSPWNRHRYLFQKFHSSMMIYPSFIKIGPVIMKGVHKSSKYYSILQWVIEISPFVFEKKKIKTWKVDRQTDQQIGEIQQVIRENSRRMNYVDIVLAFFINPDVKSREFNRFIIIKPAVVAISACIRMYSLS